MSTKRTSPESDCDEQTNEGSKSFQQDANTKRAKLLSLSDTTLQDLPMEMLEYILLKAVIMEVEGMHLARYVRMKKADLVIDRLGAVCPQWSYILTTNFFRNELQRTLDGTVETTMCYEILHRLSPSANESEFVYEAITHKDELFMICKSDNDAYYAIYVYDLNNMAEVKDVVPLPGTVPTAIASCSVSNCVYILNSEASDLSVLRITEIDERQFIILPFISDLRSRYDGLSVAANGSLFLTRRKRCVQRAVISVYDRNGHLQNETRLSSDVSKVIPKSNGNFVVVSFNDHWETKLMEIDINSSTIIREYQSSLYADNRVCQADNYGRILIMEWQQKMELLDAEFNLLNFTGSQVEEDPSFNIRGMVYNSERNEIVSTLQFEDTRYFLFSFAQFIEE